MTKKHFVVLIFVSFIGGILGGFMSNQLFSNNVYAAKGKNDSKTTIPDVIKAKEFLVIDDKGSISGTFNNNGISIKKSNSGRNESIELNTFGLQAKFETEREKMESIYTPFGFGFRQYSFSEILKSKNEPLYFLSNAAENMQSIWIGNDGESKSGAIKLFDDNYNLRLVLGGTKLHTPRTDSITQTSAASLVLFNDRGNVIWQAP